MDYVLSTENLSKQYKNFKALNRLSMHVEKGAIYGFIGKNGAGKTTLIRLICGLQNPTSGEYTIYGEKYTSPNILKVRRRMGAVVETPSIYLDLTAEDNLREQYAVLGRPSYDGIRELLELVGLSDTGKKKVRNFSLGMRQRLWIAIALAGNPDFLVLDEPTAGVDIELRRQLWDYVLELNKMGVTIVLTTHYLEEAQELCDTIAIIDHGTLVTCEPTRDLLRRIDNKTLLIRPAAELGALPSLAGIHCEMRNDGMLAVQYNPGDTPAGQVLSEIMQSGIEIADIETEGAELETVFMKLTGSGA